MADIIKNLTKDPVESKEFRHALQTICTLGYLSKDELRLMLWLYAHGGGLYHTWQREISREIRMHRASLNRIIKRLSELGIIKREDLEETEFVREDGLKIKRKYLDLTFSPSGTIAYAKNLENNYSTWLHEEILKSLGTLEDAQAAYDKRSDTAYWRGRWEIILRIKPEYAELLKEIRCHFERIGDSFDCVLNNGVYEPKIELIKPRPLEPEVWVVAQHVWRSDNFEKWNYDMFVNEIKKGFEDYGYYKKYRESLGLKSGIISRFERDW